MHDLPSGLHGYLLITSTPCPVWRRRSRSARRAGGSGVRTTGLGPIINPWLLRHTPGRPLTSTRSQRSHGGARRCHCGSGRRRRKRGPVDGFSGTAVIGIGNEFRRDDGVGWAVVALLRQRAAQRPLPRGTVLAQCDGDPGRLLDLWEKAGLAIVVDACFPPSAQPGRTHRWDAAAGGVPSPIALGRHSTHGLGLAEALRLGDALGRGPGRLVVYAVEGTDRSVGLGITSAVAAAVPHLVRRIEADIARRNAFSHDARSGTGPSGVTRRTAFAARRPPA
ncbi:hydrogenase maturation protease [Streptomyces sp. NPDC127106]|uniref:hydrogenase maturation protease n=1 Tax=Streptomyces sp. NPDC127106 TaxID=3345360 RepID=UPI0036257A72